ncbi:MAG: Stage V sporulation protein E Required for spore cortex synthesi [Parcubacteria group bacterium Gr01-1014_48]|nr:MAG: Stage V sporulation protein E Required for spore cortex synthesi [Parcubacteria group bacterium Greene0416_14]TSC74144.1 MAG: Stage V sporulation protein E Required for spore cortex synthesi [Parcubacteria group bacterium Gr01-1014_48]TSD01699.1 MAG: Stage V sporulation protein E Required for spore cortex synthesi [Parcubacteria group bacterium Greene1014_15]TSD08167.1 MAG: Stage V sporulation protein E Required for spore cortex synthesi [Parcubacteria group bacterium Greene0714_4]
MKAKADKVFLALTLILSILGFFIFASASLGLRARDAAAFSSMAFNQGFLGLFLGMIFMLLVAKVPYRLFYKYSLYIFILAVIVTLLVFVPGIGTEFGGAQRWLLIGSVSFQPAEFLKIAFVLYFAATLMKTKEHLQSFKEGIIPLLVILGSTGAILLAQPNTSSFAIIFIAAIAMFIVSGARWRYVFSAGAIALAGLALLALMRPYVRDRIVTFLDPSKDALGSSYQIQQSLIAIGSGKIFGRGFGQSIQKFGLLPEPVGDSIFAVAAEEFGFVGSILLVTLFLIFAYRGLRIAIRAPDIFGGLVATGLVIMITSQSFLNISAMLGIVPLTGTTLLFVSHGGTALLFALIEVGILLNISSYQSKKAMATI